MAYSCWLLNGADRDRLMTMVAPAYPDVIAHHVTDRLGDIKTLSAPSPAEIEVVGFADDGEGVQALVVRVNGSSERHDGGIYHITWSIDRAAGRKPQDSNDVIRNKGWTPFSVGWKVGTEPKVFR